MLSARCGAAAAPRSRSGPYLMTCVRNAWYDQGRQDGRVDVSDDVPEDINLALLNVPPDSEDARMVAAAFASLPERWQMVLWHTEVEGRPAAEVAPLLGPGAQRRRRARLPGPGGPAPGLPPGPSATAAARRLPRHRHQARCLRRATGCRRVTGARSTSTSRAATGARRCCSSWRRSAPACGACSCRSCSACPAPRSSPTSPPAAAWPPCCGGGRAAPRRWRPSPCGVVVGGGGRSPSASPP